MLVVHCCIFQEGTLVLLCIGPGRDIGLCWYSRSPTVVIELNYNVLVLVLNKGSVLNSH